MLLWKKENPIFINIESRDQIMKIKNACVIGAGAMGSGIAQLLATNGYNVNLVDLSDNILESAKNSIEMNLDRFFISKNKILEEDAKKILENIKLTTNRDEAIKGVQIVIEAVFEDMPLKQKLFAELDSNCDQDVILASNTSSLSISQIASESVYQERIVGIHFFNPAPVMKLIELIKGKNTSKEVLNTSKEFSESLGKVVVTINDSPGFVTSRLIYVMCNEAIKMKEEEIASTEDIDIAVKNAFNFPMGPLALSDLVGLDVYARIGDYLASEFGKFYQPSNLMRKMVGENLLGRKTRKGFYDY